MDGETVTPEALTWASRRGVQYAKLLGDENCAIVIDELGIEPYAEWDTDGRLRLRDLTPLQVVAFTAALEAMYEAVRRREREEGVMELEG